MIFGEKKRSTTGWPKKENPLVEAVRKAKWRYLRPDGTPLYRPPPELEWDKKKGRMVVKKEWKP